MVVFGGSVGVVVMLVVMAFGGVGVVVMLGGGVSVG